MCLRPNPLAGTERIAESGSETAGIFDAGQNVVQCPRHLPDVETGRDKEKMPILRDIPVALTAEQLIAARGQRPVRPELLRDAEQVIALGQSLWQPMALYDWFDVRAVDGELVRVVHNSGGGEAVLRVGPKADLLTHARRVLVSVGTIGPALEQRVHDLQVGGEGLKSFLLDSAGVLALGAAGEAIRCLAEETAAELGWGVGPALAPGSLVGWPLQGQRALCALLPLEQIGVRLNSHCVLEPHKSSSTLIGLGPSYDSAHVGSVCKYCALQDTCWRRREEIS